MTDPAPLHPDHLAEIDTALEDLLNPKPRYSVILEFPCDLDGDVVASLLEHIEVYAEDLITTHNGRVVGTYEEDYL